MRTTAGWVLRAALALLFIYAGAAKLADVRTFAADIANYRLVPAPLVSPMAVMLPGVELACGFGLLLARTARAAGLMVAAMLGLFTIAGAQALARGINIDCGCFGSVRAPVTVLTIVRDLAMLAVAVAALAPAPPTRSAP